ncbi:hypothetical protein ABW19_dt0201099 [Dactylella cylindrospora]|nr:hypothetical protein ABW19_dt0201099 [Dactylella cylindrospora]
MPRSIHPRRNRQNSFRSQLLLRCSFSSLLRIVLEKLLKNSNHIPLTRLPPLLLPHNSLAAVIRKIQNLPHSIRDLHDSFPTQKFRKEPVYRLKPAREEQLKTGGFRQLLERDQPLWREAWVI